MQFKPDNPHEVLRLYQGGASILGLAKACGVSDTTMVLFLRDRGVYKRTYAVSRTRVNKPPQRPTQISGKELSDEWWESNNQAFCDAMDRGYPGMKF
jgi:hypothetical protein